MATLQPMPQIVIPPASLFPFGLQWAANGNSLARNPPNSSAQLCGVVDVAVGDALAAMLNNAPVITPNELFPKAVDGGGTSSGLSFSVDEHDAVDHVL